MRRTWLRLLSLSVTSWMLRMCSRPCQKSCASTSNLVQSNSAMGDFTKKKEEQGASFQDAMLKFVRTLPKLLKYLPNDKAQDARNFMLSFQYLLAGSSDNLQNFLVILTDRYVVDEPPNTALASPVEYPALGIWHPQAPNMFTDTLTTSGTTLALSW